MSSKLPPRHAKTGNTIDTSKLDRVVAEARQASDQRALGYREQALKLYPWVCGRCGRDFNHANLRELTVHHKDMNHDNNPPDGSNWELLCVYCHDNEHARYVEPGHGESSKDGKDTSATYNPFADLASLLKPKK
jgi:hypothetical protein